MLHNNLIKKLKEIGYIKVINFLNLEEVEDLKNKIVSLLAQKEIM